MNEPTQNFKHIFENKLMKLPLGQVTAEQELARTTDRTANTIWLWQLVHNIFCIETRFVLWVRNKHRLVCSYLPSNFLKENTFELKILVSTRAM